MYYNFVVYLTSCIAFSLVYSKNHVKRNVLADESTDIDSTQHLVSTNSKRDIADIKDDTMQNNVWDIFINGNTRNYPNLNAHFQPYSPSQLTWNLIKGNLNNVEHKITLTSNNHQQNGPSSCSTERSKYNPSAK